MSGLQSFGQGLNCVVLGASGAIGAAFVAQLCADPAVASVMACARSEPSGLPPEARFVAVDIEREDTIAAAAEAAKAPGPVHLVIVAVGILHRDDGIEPEKTWRSLDAGTMDAVFRINTIGPALAAKHFLPLLSRDSKSVFAALSARVGSIGDNHLGGWYAYRASKAALNQILRTASIELARKNTQALCIGLHPGTVDSRLSEPFQRNVKDGKLFTPEFSAQSLLKVIDARGPQDTGHVFAWDGELVPY